MYLTEKEREEALKRPAPDEFYHDCLDCVHQTSIKKHRIDYCKLHKFAREYTSAPRTGFNYFKCNDFEPAYAKQNGHKQREEVE